MTQPGNKPRFRNGTGLLLRWHRYLGLTAALFVVLLAVTGWLLNHTEALALDSRYVKSDLLLSLYGISPPKQPLSFSVGDHWISQLDDQLYFDTEPVAGHYGPLAGAVALVDRMIVATDNRILILSRDAKVIEEVGPAEGAPGNITAIALAPDGKVLVKGGHGIYLTGADLLEWRQTTASNAIQWVPSAKAPAHLQDQLTEHWRGNILSWERIILDLHSGRILGTWGPWFLDLVALLIVLLAATGCYLWWGRRPRRRP